MRYVTLSILSLFFLTLFPASALAEEAVPTLYETAGVYAESVYSSGTDAYQPTNALGEPDGVSMSYFDRDAVVIFDMGTLVNGDLTLYVDILDFGAAVWVDFMSEELYNIDYYGNTFNTTDEAVTIPYDGTEPYRYVRVRSNEEEVWTLDALMADEEYAPSTEEEETGTTEEETETEIEEEETVTIPQGMLVKLVDDGNPETTVASAVYVIGADGMRHAFPSEIIFNSWFENFDDVAFIDPANLAGYQLGGNVTVRPGTWLVKITTDPKVYAVEPGGVLRWITSEEIAEDIYGEDWAERVIDVPDVFFSNYERGEDIESTVPPTGTLAETGEGDVVYIQNGSYYSILSSVGEYMRFNYDFGTTPIEGVFNLLIDAGDLEEDPDIAYPY